MEVLILGSAAATPTTSRNPTSQVLTIDNEIILIDCGEGTQVQLRHYGINLQKINYIFISHLHGDHFFGLVGLLQTQQLLGRKNELTIVAPKGIQDIVDVHSKYSYTKFNFPINYITTNTKESYNVISTKKTDITTIPLKHRIPCTGYLFKEKKKLPNIKKSAIEEYNIPIQQIASIKNGKDFTTEDGKIVSHKELVTTTPKQKSYAFCSDTSYKESVIPIIQNTDLLYHEATFIEEHRDRAKKTQHSTAKEAAIIANKASVNKLIIGHFSHRYKDFNVLLTEAKTHFPNTELALEGRKFKV